MKAKPKYHRRGIYLLPNLCTTVGLFASFYAIIAAMKGSFGHALAAVYIAMLADALDGRVARMTGTQSAFGEQFDSLADMISSGVAPAVFVYGTALRHLGKIGWLIAFCYMTATALRLARFNVQTRQDKRYFVGLPCPPAATFVTSVAWISIDYGLNAYYAANIVMAVIVTIIALLMTGNIFYFSFKDLDLIGRVPFFFILIGVLAVVAIAWNPPWVLLALSGCYVLLGPVLAVYRWRRRHKQRRRQRPPDTSRTP